MGFLLPLLAMLPMSLASQDAPTLKAYLVRANAINQGSTDDDLEAWARIRRQKALAKETVRLVRIDEVPKEDLKGWYYAFSMAEDYHGAVRVCRRRLAAAETDAERLVAATDLCMSLTEAGRTQEAVSELGKLAPPMGEAALPFRNVVHALLERADRAFDFDRMDRLYRRALATYIEPTDGKPSPNLRERDGLLMAYAEFVGRKKGKQAGIALLTEAMERRPGGSARLTCRAAQMDLIGRPMPELNKTDSIGSFPGFGAWRGKTVLAVFTAHWCGPCIGEIPQLAELLRRRRDLKAVGITAHYGFYNEEKKLTPATESARVSAWMRRYGMTWPMVFTAEADHLKYGVDGLPQILVIDRNGVVRGVKGGFGGDLEDLERMIDQVEQARSARQER